MSDSQLIQFLTSKVGRDPMNLIMQYAAKNKMNCVLQEMKRVVIHKFDEHRTWYDSCDGGRSKHVIYFHDKWGYKTHKFKYFKSLKLYWMRSFLIDNEKRLYQDCFVKRTLQFDSGRAKDKKLKKAKQSAQKRNKNRFQR